MAKRYFDNQKAKKLAEYNPLRKSGKTAMQASKAVSVDYMTLLWWEKGLAGRRDETRDVQGVGVRRRVCRPERRARTGHG